MKHKTTKEEKFEVVYQSYADEVYRVCLWFTRDEEKAQEIAQQTFVNFYEYFEEVSPECWLAYLVCTAKDLSCAHQKDLVQKR